MGTLHEGQENTNVCGRTTSIDVAVMGVSPTADESINTELKGEEISDYISLKEKYQKKLATIEARQLALKGGDKLAEEHQATLEERDHLLIMVTELEIVGAQTLQSQSRRRR